ncbi:hypothetical protein FB565_005063 [Actinoplanes lutulentus]|uniref:Uncharacterized protein n=1 Tax=Actinoplanes lutulentus TaxID=1287878 RepID=A0A327ZGQ5_9ACTN|nr:hypothetical protein [Actinoplanes lutulentus]MBB2945330.1 hypothetical protein [Actinoplanes lutulentus]RAK40535.1 hypothetical protein B0I29_103573 [Actinoplanes lutulentus]
MDKDFLVDDEDCGALLLRPLGHGTPDGVARVDVAKAMRDGLRARRARAWSTAVAVTAGVAVVVTGGLLVLRPQNQALPPVLPADPSVPASCTASALPAGDAKSAEVNAGDPSGRYLVGASEPVEGGDHNVLVWRDGKLVADVAYQGPRVSMTDINASGVAVGATTGGVTLPYAYESGRVTRMKGAGNAVAINDAGIVAGDTEPVIKDPQPQRWASWDAEPELMPMPAGMTAGQAFDITEDGTILTSLWSRNVGGIYLWHADGTVEKVEPPKAAPGHEVFAGPLAFHFGWLYAEVRTPSLNSSESTPEARTVGSNYRYDPASRTWQDLGTKSYSVQVPAVQRRGGGFLQNKPTVYVGKKVLTLPPLAKYDDDAFKVAFISADARVVAGSNLSGVAAERPVLPIIWRCR